MLVDTLTLCYDGPAFLLLFETTTYYFHFIKPPWSYLIKLAFTFKGLILKLINSKNSLFFFFVLHYCAHPPTTYLYGKLSQCIIFTPIGTRTKWFSIIDTGRTIARRRHFVLSSSSENTVRKRYVHFIFKVIIIRYWIEIGYCAPAVVIRRKFT